MRSDETASRTDRSEQIRTPDQVQQAKRADRLDTISPSDTLPEAGDRSPNTGGILGQLSTERAHD